MLIDPYDNVSVQSRAVLKMRNPRVGVDVIVVKNDRVLLEKEEALVARVLGIFPEGI